MERKVDDYDKNKNKNNTNNDNDNNNNMNMNNNHNKNNHNHNHNNNHNNDDRNNKSLVQVEAPDDLHIGETTAVGLDDQTGTRPLSLPANMPKEVDKAKTGRTFVVGHAEQPPKEVCSCFALNKTTQRCQERALPCHSTQSGVYRRVFKLLQ
jgi:hypothetical protein